MVKTDRRKKYRRRIVDFFLRCDHDIASSRHFVPSSRTFNIMMPPCRATRQGRPRCRRSDCPGDTGSWQAVSASPEALCALPSRLSAGPLRSVLGSFAAIKAISESYMYL